MASKFCGQCGAPNEQTAAFCKGCGTALPQGYLASPTPPATVDSYFDGGVLGYIGVQIGTALGLVFTLGFALPWVLAWRQGWYTSHTVIEGRRLRFTGSGISLGWTWVKIWLLTLITLGIYSFWARIRVQKWIVFNTRFAVA